MNDAMKARLAALGYTGANQDMLDTHLKTFTYPDEIRKELMQMGESFWDSASGPSFYLPLTDKGAGEVDTKEVFGATPTFTRATTATTVDRTGTIVSVASGVPRSYYDPTSLTYLGYLAEGVRTNICLRSQEFDNASWVKNDTTITANSIAAPDGTTTADLATEGTLLTANLTQTVTVTANVNTAYSFFVKKGNHRFVNMDVFNGADFFQARWDLDNGVIGTTNTNGTATVASHSIQKFPNGWYRCTVVGNLGGAITSVIMGLHSAFSASNSNRVANSTFYYWGAQIENNVSFPSSYIPTTTVSVTRATDALSYSTTGWINETVGTMYSKFVHTEAGSDLGPNSRVAFDLDDGSNNNRHHVYNINGTGVGLTQSGGATQASPTISGTVAADVTTAQAYAYQANNFIAAKDGSLSAVDDSGTVPSGITTARIATNFGGSVLFGAVKEVVFYPRRLDDTHLQMLTKHGVKYV